MFVFLALQRRLMTMLVVLTLLVPLAAITMPIPKGYTDRLSTIASYDEVQDKSALGRLHFWRVALTMAARNPAGIGLWGFQSAYRCLRRLRRALRPRACGPQQFSAGADGSRLVRGCGLYRALRAGVPGVLQGACEVSRARALATTTGRHSSPSRTP